MFKLFKSAFSKTSQKIAEGFSILNKNKNVDGNVLQELLKDLIKADVGVSKSENIINKIKKAILDDSDIEDAVISEIKNSFTSNRKIIIDKKPFVMLVVGVNGNGKTTTIAKLANFYKNKGFSVMVAACDTFRAAATEQLQFWCDSLGVLLYKDRVGADPASIAYKAVEKSIENGSDVLLIDTSGRIHNRDDLMAELSKIIKVIKKLLTNAPHEILLLLDATTGQSGQEQAKVFLEKSGITGVILTKMDGTAKGGCAISISENFKLPILFVCCGESIGDIFEFDVERYAKTIIA